MMKNVLLVILSLIAGYEVSSDVPGCLEGWFEFTCNNPERHQIDVNRPKQPPIHSTKKDGWEHYNEVHLYHSTSNKNLRVVINKLEHRDFGDYWCKIGKKTTPKIDLDWEEDSHDCQERLSETTYATTTTNFTCDRPKTSSVTFFCKEEGFTCTDILSTVSSPVSNGRFMLTVSKRVFNITITRVTAQDTGVYWCGRRSISPDYRTAHKKIQLEVRNIPTSTTSAAVGQTVTYSCQYEGVVPVKKYVCKGEHPSTCERVVSTSGPQNGRFSIKDDRTKKNITITLRNLKRDDTGTYWCGAENTHPQLSDQFFHKLELTVEPPPSATTSIHAYSSSSYSTSFPRSTTASDESQDTSWLIGLIVAVICVSVLVLVLVLVLFCRRAEGSKNGGAQNEDHCYAEIQELPQKSDSGTAPKSVYVTANFPTSHYSNVQLPVGSGGTCSTVTGNNQTLTYSTVNEPCTLTYNTTYYTVNNPQL